MTKNSQPESSIPNPALKQLDVFVGEWKVELKFPADPPVIAHITASFEWFEGGAFLSYHLGNRATDSHYAIHVIGRDDSAETYTMVYVDDRGVSRIYQMSLEGGKWKQWRDAPGFAQRFVGAFSDDGNTITARWEKSYDGTNWEHDFDLTYTRVMK